MQETTICLPQLKIPNSSSTMPTASSLILKDPQTLSPEEAMEDRETFSHQTLILTVLTAINSPSNHPSLNDGLTNKQRIRYMMEKADHTPVIDAATTILVTDTEILATMSRGVCPTHTILALKEVNEKDLGYKGQLDQSKSKGLDLNISCQTLEDIDEILPADLDVPVPDDGVFISFPNINEAINLETSTERLPIDSSQQSSTGSDAICKPIVMDHGHWTQIMESKSGIIFESSK
jgi:hypothetical protein